VQCCEHGQSKKRPERIFRYFPTEASDFFAAKKFWLSSLKDYNDPFDAFPRFDLLLEGQFNHLIKAEYAFSPPQVNCTYLGWQMSELYRNELISSLEQDDWKHVEKFVMCHDKTKYAIEPIPWEQWQKKPTIYHEELDRVIPITNKD
jgi:hypothetical protein